ARDRAREHAAGDVEDAAREQLEAAERAWILERLETVHLGVEPGAERREVDAVPAHDVVREHGRGRCEEVARDDEAAAEREDRLDEAHRSAAERPPRAAAPAGEVVRGERTGARELPARDDLPGERRQGPRRAVRAGG